MDKLQLIKMCREGTVYVASSTGVYTIKKIYDDEYFLERGDHVISPKRIKYLKEEHVSHNKEKIYDVHLDLKCRWIQHKKFHAERTLKEYGELKEKYPERFI